MIAQLFLTLLLGLAGLYAWSSYKKTPPIAVMVGAAAGAGLYFVWFPDQANWLAGKVGIGRGVDLILYVWVVLTLLAILNLYITLRVQLEMITNLARQIALRDARVQEPGSETTHLTQ